MTMTAREVIETYYASSERHDRATWLSLFDENLVMDEQIEGRIVGVENLTRVIAKMDQGYASFQNKPNHFVYGDDGQQACVISHISATTRDGTHIECGVANYFQVRGGKIVYMANFHDTRPFESFIQQQQGSGNSARQPD